MWFLIITVIMAVILLAIYFLGGIGTVAILKEEDKESKKIGCSVLAFILIILIIVLLMLRGLRSCVS